MKKNNLLIGAVLCLGLIFTSCSKSDDTCHPCHLEAALWADILDADGDTLGHAGDIEIWDIANPAGVIGGDFCGADMAVAEDPNYVHVFTDEEDPLTGDFSGAPLTAAYYAEHSDDFVVHCEEHEGHDDHDGK